MVIVAVGIDLAKNVFNVRGVDATGKAVPVRPCVARAKLPKLIAPLAPCLIDVQACSGAHLDAPVPWLCIPRACASPAHAVDPRRAGRAGHRQGQEGAWRFLGQRWRPGRTSFIGVPSNKTAAPMTFCGVAVRPLGLEATGPRRHGALAAPVERHVRPHPLWLVQPFGGNLWNMKKWLSLTHPLARYKPWADTLD